MTDESKIFSIDIKAVGNLYRSHCAEQGISDGAWRYRYVSGLPIAIVVAGLIFVLYSWWDPFHPARTFRPAPESYALIAFALAYGLFTSSTWAMYTKHRIKVLKRAGIEIPMVAAAPSFMALMRNRKEIRRQYRLRCVQHGSRSYVVWAALQVGGLLLYFALCFWPFLRGLTPVHSLEYSIGIFLFVAVLWLLISESLYLDLCWRGVNSHDPCNSCAPSY